MITKKIRDLKEFDFSNFLVWDIYDNSVNIENFLDLEVRPYFFDANTEILVTKIQDVIDAYFLVKAKIFYKNTKEYIKNGFILISDLIFTKNKDFYYLTPFLFYKKNIKKIDISFLKAKEKIKININLNTYPYFSNYYIFYLKDINQTKSLALNIFNLIKQNIRNLGYFNILFTGDLGVGKTTFIKSIIEKTNSPTFNIMNKFKIDNLNIIHWDLYRLENYETINLEKELDFIQYLQQKDNINLIEWANKLALEFYSKNIDKNNFIVINLEYINQNSRVLTLHFNNSIFNGL